MFDYNNKELKAVQDSIFIHSLFRSGSTYFYNALKRTGNLHVYHEPTHEVIATLLEEQGELTSRNDQLKTDLRHPFLEGGYFDEYIPFIEEINAKFKVDFSYKLFFMGSGDESSELSTYISLLIQSAQAKPVLQCTRLFGRISWLRKNFSSTHIMIVRNPWDQWYSYKVDDYISATPRIILSQANLPLELQALMSLSGASILVGDDLMTMREYGWTNTLTTEEDYLLFFGIWLYAFVEGQKLCSIVIDMDDLSNNVDYRAEVLQHLDKIGLIELDIEDISLHRAMYLEAEMSFFYNIEDRVFGIFRDMGVEEKWLEVAACYLMRQRAASFVLKNSFEEKHALLLEDAARMRALLHERDEQLARLTKKHNLSTFSGDRQVVEYLGPDAFFTVCSKNFLAHARVLYHSIHPHYPNSKFFVVLCDQVDDLFDPLKEPFDFIYLEDLALPDLQGMAIRYNITELNTAVKPFAFKCIMQKIGLSTVVYLDPDLFFVDRMHELDKLFHEGAEAILTPHILQPSEDGQINDKSMLRFGIYNLGFLALKRSDATTSFLSWWGRRLEHECVIRLEEGLFVDQKWADLLPAFVEKTRIIHHPGYNIAYWNLPQRKIIRRDNIWYANDQPLRFVHFSGNTLDDKNVFSRHSQEVTIQNIGDMRELLDSYRDKVYEQGHAFYRALPYAYSWNGEAGINLHTPKELDLAATENISPVFTSYLYQYALNVLSAIQNRLVLLSRAIPIAKRLSGGWLPFVRRAWRVYRLHGWHHFKAKAVELSRYYTLPPVLTQQAHVATQSAYKSLRLLYLDWATPKPDQDAASVTAKLLMEIVDSLGYKVTFIPCGLKYEPRYHEDMIAANIQVVVYPEIDSVDDWLSVNAASFDVCILARGPVAWPYLKTLKSRAPNLRLIFNTVDLHYLRELRQAELTNDKAAQQVAMRVRDQELDLIEKCDLSILLSNEELYTIREINPEASLTVLPVIFSDIPGSRTPFAQRRDILFIGSFPHQPNIDAVLYFAKTVFPLVLARIPDIRFKVIGANPPESIKRLADEQGIDILGFVKELEPIFSNIRISVAPLRYGAGIKGKIGTSLCYGVPCVATPIAIEGMGLSDCKNILIGASPAELAEAVCKAYLDETLWDMLSMEGHRFAVENYSVDVIRKRVENILWALREDWPPLNSAFELDSWDAFSKHSSRLSGEYVRRIEREQTLLPKDESTAFVTKGYCAVCHLESEFLTSFMYSTGNTPDGRQMPNWREHMQCSHCGLVNRMRAALHALHLHAKPKSNSRIYITERVTQTYKWLAERYPVIVGSEYLGHDIEPGVIVNGIRHEDVMNLSFNDCSFDRVLSFDVLEHVPYPDRAFREVYRVLDHNGVFLFSVPFSATSRSDIVRASLRSDGTVEHHLPAEYHGNPVDLEGGALCYRYFGWDCLDRLREIGFRHANCLAYWSEEQGYLGGEQYLFIARK